MSKDSTTEKPTWFLVRKINHYYGRSGNPETDVYEVNFRTVDRLHGRRELGWGGDFKTIAEAVAASEAKGWVRVKDWKEARQLARPYQEAQQAESDRVRAARAGTVVVRIDLEPTDGRSYGGKNHMRFVSPEIAATLLEMLGEGDEHKVVTKLASS